MKILQIGCGGIGSYLATEIQEEIEKLQLPNVEVTIADDDMVEVEQLLYQNFEFSDIGKNKAEALANRCEDIINLNERITTEKQLEGYDLFLIAGDNTKVRKLVFEYCHKNGKEFIDLRAEGRMIFAMPKFKLANDLETLDLTDTQNGSCQIKAELDNGWIQKGNKIVAMIGIQMLLNQIRGQANKKIVLKI